MSNQYTGMTINERLFAANLLDDFDQAARNRDKDLMIEIIMKVELSTQQARETTETILNNPSKYGY